jgi:glycosyltransferase involved in cell wall biosynthesis
MNIAQIVCAYPPYAGGIGIGAKRFRDLLVKGGDNQVTTFTLSPLQPTTSIKSGDIKGEIKGNEIKDNEIKDDEDIIYLSPWLRRGHGGLTWSLLKQLCRFDVIFLHYPFFGAAEIIWLYKILKPEQPLIIYYHMDTEALPLVSRILAWPSHLVRRSLFKKANLIIGSSFNYIKHSQIAPIYEQFPEKFREIPFGLDTEKFCPRLPEETGGLVAKAKAIVEFINQRFIKRDRINLLFVGGLDSAHYFKGLPVLLEALAGLNNKLWRLNIVGSGNLETTYQAQAKTLGLDKQINFTGKVSDSDLIKHYQDSDIFILPSINQHEAFGLVLTEAMACGNAVIASNLPGVRTVFRNGRDGWLVEPNSVPELRQKLKDLITDGKKRREMGRSARIYAVERYGLDRIEKKIKQAFAAITLNSLPPSH